MDANGVRGIYAKYLPPQESLFERVRLRSVLQKGVKQTNVKASWDVRKNAIKDGKGLNQNLLSWLPWDRESKTVTVATLSTG